MKKKSFIVLLLCVLLAVFSFGCVDLGLEGNEGSNDEPQTPQTDYVSIVNDVTIKVMSANFKVVVAKASGFDEIDFSQGSGVVVNKNETTILGDTTYTYTLLTNNHVVANGNIIENRFYVVDYKGERISATLKKRDPNYDLAVLEFESAVSYNYVGLSQREVFNVDEPVFAVGTPLSQINAITIGKILGQVDAPTSTDANSTIAFKVFKHSARTDSGSSGSMLLDENLKLIGLNYGGIIDSETEEFLSSVAVPVGRLIERLNEWNIEYKI